MKNTIYITQVGKQGDFRRLTSFSKKKILKLDFWATKWSLRPQKPSTDSLDLSLQDSKKIFMFPSFFEIFWANMLRSSM